MSFPRAHLTGWAQLQLLVKPGKDYSRELPCFQAGRLNGEKKNVFYWETATTLTGSGFKQVALEKVDSACFRSK